MLIIEIEKRHNKMVDRIRYPTVSYLPFYYVFFQFLLLTIFNLQANILTTKDIGSQTWEERVSIVRLLLQRESVHELFAAATARELYDATTNDRRALQRHVGWCVDHKLAWLHPHPAYERPCSFTQKCRSLRQIFPKLR